MDVDVLVINKNTRNLHEGIVFNELETVIVKVSKTGKTAIIIKSHILRHEQKCPKTSVFFIIKIRAGYYLSFEGGGEKKYWGGGEGGSESCTLCERTKTFN